MKSRKILFQTAFLVLTAAFFVGLTFFLIPKAKDIAIAPVLAPVKEELNEIIIGAAPEGLHTGHFEAQVSSTGVLGYKSYNNRRKTTTTPVPPTTPVAPVTPASPTTPTTPVTPPAPLVNYSYGVSTGGRLPWLSDADLATTLDSYVYLGTGWIRMDFDWTSIQPNYVTTYDWSNIDRVIKAATARNLKVLPILTYTPAWARPADCTNDKCAPANPTKFATFAAEAAKRYAPQGVHTWEIWNEPNLSMFWQPAPDAKVYANLLKLASAAIKNQDTQAKIITGGLSPADTAGLNISPIDFLTRLYQTGVASSFDAVGMHPYTYPFLPTDANPWSAWLQMSVTKPNLRSIMANNGDSAKQIWLTEYGVPTGGPGLAAVAATNNYSGQYDHVSEALQAQIVSNMISNYKTLTFAGPLFWYTDKDLGTSNSTNENFFGLIRYDGSEKPAFGIFKSLISVQ
jgi:polysaccharide biosynthesis protein PslG